jgi:phenylacetate-CoA ligase
MRKGRIHADLRKRRYREWIRFLKESEGWSKEEIDEHQLGEIRRIVRYAYENTKAYRALYDRVGITPQAIETINDFRRLPFIEKETIRGSLGSFSARVRGRSHITTGGSTGIPLGFYRDPAAFVRELASKAYQYYRVGWKEGDRQLVLRGLLIPSKNHMEFIPDFNELRCSSYHLVPEWMEMYRQRAVHYRPEWIRCYPSSGYIFARFLEETGRCFPPVKGILCASEHLYDFQKNLLSKVFGARVFSHYGHYEMAVLAGFCEHEDTYHVLPQYGYAELIDGDGQPVTEPGRIGEVVATSFIMHATPFVRYRTQDLALLKGWSCSSCGRPYQVWERIEGRLQELIVTGKWRYISTTMLNMHDDIYDHIKQFQFYQREPGRVVFRFIPKDSCDETVIQDMKARLLRKLGDDVDLGMERVENIPPTPRGKYRPLVQEMKLKYDVPSAMEPVGL